MSIHSHSHLLCPTTLFTTQAARTQSGHTSCALLARTPVPNPEHIPYVIALGLCYESICEIGHLLVPVPASLNHQLCCPGISLRKPVGGHRRGCRMESFLIRCMHCTAAILVCCCAFVRKPETSWERKTKKRSQRRTCEMLKDGQHLIAEPRFDFQPGCLSHLPLRVPQTSRNLYFSSALENSTLIALIFFVSIFFPLLPLLELGELSDVDAEAA